MKLYSYWRSTTSYRVRAALNLKRLAYETIPVDLVAGDQNAPEYAALNAGKGVPTLVLDDGAVLTQSLAIIEYIDATWPQPQLIPREPMARARVMAIAHAVALDIHPVNNLRIIGQLKSRFGATPDQATDWMRHWIIEGFTAIEAMLPDGAPPETPDIAGICITTQAYNAHRWGVDLRAFPKIARMEQHCLRIPAIADAHPDNQPDNHSGARV
ncbi:maleylacetoacetate isomerase [Pontivivens nitratireducens]|uniref:maleylacetoacetate isomerase n=1 Tax=Pontivivens nitratireducens TaxID=2758038 RepID=UPI00163B34C2|nr:maleylacetoacetate isomerase [Pontibrevibacter nitratireducens]